MRALGIDYGEKRLGLAFADELGLALPLPALVPDSQEALWAGLGRVIAERRIEGLVVGYPYNMDGSVGTKAREVDAFILQLERRFKLPVQRSDERLTSEAADQAHAGRRRKPRHVRAHMQERATGERDSRAAALLLQDFLDAQNPEAALLPPEETEDATLWP